MANEKLNWIKETNMFGTKISLVNKDNSFNEVVVENLDIDPFTKVNKKLKSGYLFRNPKTDVSHLSSVFETIQHFEGQTNIWAEMDNKSKTITTYVRIVDNADAAMFAFSQVENFQKWSDDLDNEARKEAKRKPQKVKINKDGTVTVKVTATSLADDDTQ